MSEYVHFSGAPLRLARLAVFLVLLFSTIAHAQVTTATIYGAVRDTTGSVLPGANVTVTNQGTNLSRAAVTDARGDFALPALPIGQYTLQIEIAGFKTYTNTSLQLGAGQVVRQTFELEVGQLSDATTVSETAPLVDAGSAVQIESLRREVQQLPVPRRNLQNLVALSPGVSLGDNSNPTGRSFRINGAGDGATAITVDGSNATANGENHGFGQYGGTNQIELMSLDAVAEIQVVKGVMPAEYGGAVGGQVNLITRSGTNDFHGSLFENYQDQRFFARDPFLPSTTAKPSVTFNQFGGSVGGPIVRNRAMFFATYEGYRDETGVTVQGTVPTGETRQRVLQALPFPETKLALDGLPLPNQAINAEVGRYITAKQQIRRDNHVLVKGDAALFGGNFSVTVSRLRPTAVNPSFAVANDERLNNASDRVTTQYVRAAKTWISETRFGWNHNTLQRSQDFWNVTDPNRPAPTEFANVDTRLGEFAIGGSFGTPRAEALEMDNHSFNLDQKVSRVMGAHTVKAGARWYREVGYKTNPQITRYAYQTLNDLLANRPNSVLVAPGQPPHEASKDEWGLFLQDDWRVNDRLMLNLGLRYDYYAKVRVKATSNIGAEIVNLERASDLRAMNFGAERPQDDLYDADPWNFGPRAGFAWKLDQAGRTVIRGGAGVLYSGQLLAVFQNMVSDPYVPGRVSWNLTQSAAKGLKWPMYADTLRNIAVADANGQKALYGIIDTQIQNPYTVQAMIDVERAIGSAWMVNGSYVHTSGRDFPMSRNFALSFDRATGARIPTSLGLPSGWYLDSSQTMDYNAFEANVKGRMVRGLELALHYTLAKGSAQQGGDLTGNFGSGVQTFLATQDFFDPDVDRGPLSQDVRHRVTAQMVYELPWLKDGRGLLSHVLGGWQLASIVNVRSGLPLRLSQPSGLGNSRPDYVGGDPVLDDWNDTLRYLNPAAFAQVPVYAATNATVRPGTQNPSQVRGPGRWIVDLSIAKSVRLPRAMQIQFRAEAFNAFNHVNYENPNTTINSADFGRLTSAAPARTGQVGIRFTF
jgi:outer membrane receptor protein involved in Fe transport